MAEPVLKQDESIEKPKRTRSWDTQVVVFVNSTDRLYVESKLSLQWSHCEPNNQMPLTPFGSEQDIYRKCGGKEDLEYLATVNLEKLGMSCRFKRMVGKMSSLYVFDHPPELDRSRRIPPRLMC